MNPTIITNYVTNVIASFPYVDTVNQFYESAWVKLIWVIGVAAFLITTAAVVLPIILQNITRKEQKKLFEEEKRQLEIKFADDLDKLRDENKNIIDEKIAEITNSINNQIKELSDSSNLKIKKAAAETTGGVLHVQGMFLFLKKSYKFSLISFIGAANDQIDCDDRDNLNKVLRKIVECLEKLNDDKSFSPKENGDIRKNYDTMMEKLNSINKNGGYSDRIKQIKILFNRLYNIEE